jgi:hypothetical protein
MRKVPLSELKFSEPRECRFFLDISQIDAIERALNFYGRDLAAMTKIVSYLRVENFYRQFEFLKMGAKTKSQDRSYVNP